MAIDTVELDEGATLGPPVALPAARIGMSATVGPASLVMRGDAVPPTHVGRATHRTVGLTSEPATRGSGNAAG